MAEHGAPEYATATGNDYGEHERTWDKVTKLTKVSAVAVAVVLVCLALLTAGASMWIWALGFFLTLGAAAIGIGTRSGTIKPLLGVLALVLVLFVIVG